MGRSKKKKNKKKKKNNKKKQSKKKKAVDDIVVDKKKQEEQSELLEQIYSISINDEFNTDDLSKFYHKKRSFWKRGIIYTLLLILMIVFSSLAGYFYFNWQEPFDGDKVLFNINLQENITAGELLDIHLNYNNLANVALTDVEVTLQMPENFELVGSQPKPKNNANNSWSLDRIPANDLGEIKLTGYFTCDNNDSENSYEYFKANLYYYPENFSSLFKDDASKKIQVIKPKLSVEVNGPSELGLKENVDYKIIYENQEDKILSGLSLKANIPNNFVVTEVVPALSEQKEFDTFTELHWKLNDLKSGDKKDINISGYFQDINATNSNKDVIYGEVYTEDKDLNKVILSADNLPISLQGGDILLTLHVNNLVNKQHLDNQKSLEYTLNYKNLSDNNLENVSLDLMVDDFVSKNPLVHILNWNTSEDKYDGSVHRTENGARVNWDVNNIEELDVLEPNEEGIITFYIDKYNNSHFSGISNWRDFIINNYIDLSYQLEGSDKVIEYKSNEVHFNYQQMLNLEDEDFVKIGQASDDKNLYKLFYKVETAQDFSEYYNLVFNFTLNEDVEWVDLSKEEIEGEENNVNKIYSQYYDEFKEKLVVKIDDLSKCEGSCNFSVLLKTNELCAEGSCLFSDIQGSVWFNNEVIRYNP